MAKSRIIQPPPKRNINISRSNYPSEVMGWVDDLPKKPEKYIDKEYMKKYPPIYLDDPKDPRINYYNEKGNQWLYKEKERIKSSPIKKMPTRGFIDYMPTNEPIKAVVKPSNNPKGYLDMRGQVEEKLPTSYQGYSEKQLEQMGYRKPNVQAYRKGGLIKNTMKYKNGGFVTGLKDYGLLWADNATSYINPNIIKDDQYSDSEFGNFAKKSSQVLGKYNQTVAPIAASVIGGPMAGQAVGGAQQMSNQFVQPEPTRYAEGGQVDKTIINVEKGELEVNPNDLKIVKEFRNKPKHPSIGIDEQGNTMATVDNIIIPKKMNQLYKKGSILQKKAIINNLQFDQAKREGTKYAFGGPVKPTPQINDQAYDLNSLLNFNPISTVPVENQRPGFTPSMQTKGLNMNNTNMNYSAEPSKNGLAYSSTSSPNSASNFNWSKAAGYGVQYAPALYNLGRGLFDKPLQLNEKDYLVNDQLNAPVLTGESGRRDMLKAYNLAKYNNRQTNGNQAGMNNLFGKYSDSLASFNENLENKNKVAKFEADKYGIENKFRNASTRLNLKQFNEQNKAAKRDFTSKGLTQVSDIYQNERNNEIMSKNLPNFLKYYDYDTQGNLILKSNKPTK